MTVAIMTIVREWRKKRAGHDHENMWESVPKMYHQFWSAPGSPSPLLSTLSLDQEMMKQTMGSEELRFLMTRTAAFRSSKRPDINHRKILRPIISISGGNSIKCVYISVTGFCSCHHKDPTWSSSASAARGRNYRQACTPWAEPFIKGRRLLVLPRSFNFLPALTSQRGLKTRQQERICFMLIMQTYFSSWLSVFQEGQERIREWMNEWDKPTEESFEWVQEGSRRQ